MTEPNESQREPTSGPSRRRTSHHSFTISDSVPAAQRGAFSELLNKRQPPSCDACRTRKLKCRGRPVVIELGEQAVAKRPCDVRNFPPGLTPWILHERLHKLNADSQNCREWQLDCSYLYQRRRRGRKNRVVERLAQQQKSRKTGAAETSDSEEEQTGGPVPMQNQSAQPAPPRHVSNYGYWSSPGILQPSSFERGATNHALPAPSVPSAIHQAYQAEEASPFSTFLRQDLFTTTPNLPQTQAGPSATMSTLCTSPQNDVSPGLAMSEASVPMQTSIGSVMSRDFALRIIDLFFEHASLSRIRTCHVEC